MVANIGLHQTYTDVGRNIYIYIKIIVREWENVYKVFRGHHPADARTDLAMDMCVM